MEKVSRPHSNMSNLNKNEKSALDELMKDIVIKPCDKGGGICV